MRLVLQRVSRASVRIDGEVVGQIGVGLLALAGVREGDDTDEAARLATKTAELRIFADDEGRFNRSLLDVGGEALVVSQFTLFADTRRGRRPPSRWSRPMRRRWRRWVYESAGGDSRRTWRLSW